MVDNPRIIVVGARSARQGLGEYVASWFARRAAEVVAIVGTSKDTVQNAQATLRERYGIQCRGYINLDEALACVPCDAVVICSPYRFHAEHLWTVGRAGKHCLCEKPLFWPLTDRDLIAPFIESGKRLEILTQWPWTLPAFFDLYPSQERTTIQSLEMRLSPITTGLDMVPDAVPHFISMLQGLVGSGSVSRLSARFIDGDPRRLTFHCVYRHGRGQTEGVLHLETCPHRPRPAWYAVNGARVDREIDLADYQQYFRSKERRVSLPDPLGLLVDSFLTNVINERPTCRTMLDQHQEFLTLFWNAAQTSRCVTSLSEQGDSSVPPFSQPSQITSGSPAPDAPAGSDAQIELAQIHNFASKLRQPEALAALKAYVRWQVARRTGVAKSAEHDPAMIPDLAPLSINLDLTTACNYACDHCIDMKILNTGIKFDHPKLLSSLATMASKGLKSVIVIGGGEPTLYPYFADTIRHMKSLGLQVAIVSNGAGNQKIMDICDCLDKNDWVRLSLDAGTDATFQKMHKPKKPVTLEHICGLVPGIRQRNPELTVGFSYIVTWKGATVNDLNIVENLHEIAQATRLARDSNFSYIGFKPFLSREEMTHAEVIGVDRSCDYLDGIITRIRAQLDEAKQLATPGFRVFETTGMKAFTSRRFEQLGQQPRQCHMQFFRQVLSPLGTYNCPVYRNQPHGCLGDQNAYADLALFEKTRRIVADRIDHFNATTTCSAVTCLYNNANWWIEGLIANPERLDELTPDLNADPDYFL